MGVVLTIHLMNTETDDVHVGCEHDGSYYTWYVSSDHHWLIVKRFDRGCFRTQVPMANIRALSVAACPKDQEKSAQLRVSDAVCDCGAVKLSPDEAEWVDPVGLVHRLGKECGR